MKGLTPAFVWKPGMKQQYNLKGTTRTLDGWDGDKCWGHKADLEDGLLAKDGWTCLDDSNNFLFDGDADNWNWVKTREHVEGAQDWYFMAYGHDYKAALKDYTLFAGRMPLPPRYAFGYWWSRYWMYSDHELRELCKNFENYNIPLDVLVIDMDWHYTDKGRGSWTGWTWNKELFPDYRKLLKDLKADNGLRVTLNLHPAEGVRSYEEQYEAVARDNGVDPATKQEIPWISSKKSFIKSMFKNVLMPMNNAGIDFWWLDWQQEPFDKEVKNLSNTWWLNYIFFSQMERERQTRPLIYHRWGGLGNHRYQVGFSGDTFISWASLDYQTYFNSTASNVLYGKVLGEMKPYDEKTGIIYWDIPYRAGELKAEGCDKDGNILSSYSIKTSGRPYALRVSADRTNLSCNRATAHLIVEVIDEKGVVVKLGDNDITCTIEGPAHLLGLEGSDNSDMSDYTDNRHRAFHGRLLTYIQTTGEKGQIRVKFTSPLLQGTEIVLNAK